MEKEKPLESNESEIHIVVGKDAKLSPEIRKTLEQLAHHLQGKTGVTSDRTSGGISITVPRCHTVMI